MLGPAIGLRKRILKALSATVGTAYGAVKRGPEPDLGRTLTACWSQEGAQWGTTVATQGAA
ncbi:hypothetical protein GCM10029978_005370 [Actinoallomurus acanthiterrae]